jgi:hypothetical protein
MLLVRSKCCLRMLVILVPLGNWKKIKIELQGDGFERSNGNPKCSINSKL